MEFAHTNTTYVHKDGEQSGSILRATVTATLTPVAEGTMVVIDLARVSAA